MSFRERSPVLWTVIALSTSFLLQATSVAARHPLKRSSFTAQQATVKLHHADKKLRTQHRPLSLDRIVTDHPPTALSISRGGSLTSLTSPISNFFGWIGDSKPRCWSILSLSIITEIQATTLIKIASDGENLPLFAVSILLYISSLIGFAISLKQIDVGVAYAVWAATGTAVVSILGMVLFGEKWSVLKIGSLGFIIVGVVGLNLVDGGH